MKTGRSWSKATLWRARNAYTMMLRVDCRVKASRMGGGGSLIAAGRATGVLKRTSCSSSVGVSKGVFSSSK